MITNPDLHRLADTLGVRLVRHNGGPKGFYNHYARIISTRRGLSIAAYRSTLAHELGHAYYKDEPTENAHYSGKQERRADQFAAQLLLNEESVKAAMIWHNEHISPAAYELEVTQHLLKVWLRNARLAA
ncbi:ImmA/IrrE family metallo-endopeptidase [Corynebacterium pseudodiphtheriticum]|uniref:ImmA/IrrE family metallo-endopeptidase n=1 Tax=Corynebacterium pseudodiphtheriticum TaxID=37637 RepID=UPI0025410F1B|nr:ImmA/IrrE family metallo-endopeptidase [Corynebacterium pseudodiphtheriticum]MDK4286975.1 ImmA/IrrE family metallo-endopeptidase [Corynebacterium pseudodiphtheriticum]